MSNKEYDVIVLGGSIPGYHSAVEAARNGLKTAIIEENRLGGIQTLAAEMPVQTLLENDKVLKACKKSTAQGLKFSNIAFDPDSFYTSIRDNATAFSKDLVDSLKEAGVDVYLGQGTLGDDHTVIVEREDTNPRELGWKKLVLALEPETKIPEAIKDQVQGFYTHENFGLLDNLPNGLIIFGYGEKALQAATVWSGLGAKVYLICPEKEILLNVPEDIVNFYNTELENRGVKIYVDSVMTDVFQDSAGEFHVEFEDKVTGVKKSVNGTELMILAHTESNLKGLEAADLELEDDWIVTDQNLATSNPDIYTWTDTDKSLGNHSIDAQAARYIAQVLSGKEDEPFEYESEYSILNLNPPYAAIGTVDKEELEDEEVVIGSYGEIMPDEDYFEIIVDPEFGEIIGAQALGQNAENLISTISLLIDSESSAYDLEETNLPEESHLNIIKKAVKQAKKINGRENQTK